MASVAVSITTIGGHIVVRLMGVLYVILKSVKYESPLSYEGWIFNKFSNFSNFAQLISITGSNSRQYTSIMALFRGKV